ncbi:hypothetical protein QL285_074503 [Trifolium repens]|nr:hypothetical protein QL285_074503 [Trifolium repens]
MLGLGYVDVLCGFDLRLTLLPSCACPLGHLCDGIVPHQEPHMTLDLRCFFFGLVYMHWPVIIGSVQPIVYQFLLCVVFWSHLINHVDVVTTLAELRGLVEQAIN